MSWPAQSVERPLLHVRSPGFCTVGIQGSTTGTSMALRSDWQRQASAAFAARRPTRPAIELRSTPRTLRTYQGEHVHGGEHDDPVAPLGIPAPRLAEDLDRGGRSRLLAEGALCGGTPACSQRFQMVRDATSRRGRRHDDRGGVRDARGAVVGAGHRRPEPAAVLRHRDAQPVAAGFAGVVPVLREYWDRHPTGTLRRRHLLRRSLHPRGRRPDTRRPDRRPQLGHGDDVRPLPGHPHDPRRPRPDPLPQCNGSRA